jgi:AraC-like DNA-binding protein/mannose-6-phosphate isomerase-like protein (cupin superfamily)
MGEATEAVAGESEQSPGSGPRGGPGVGPGGGPVVVGANWYRFRPSEHIHHELVASVSFVWALEGAGTIRVGRDAYDLTAQSLLCLPWRHEVEYRADARSPFHVGTVHVVPWHDHAVVVEPRVAFLPGDPLRAAGFRRGSRGERSAELVAGASPAGRAIIALSSYAVERFMSGPFDEHVFRALGTLLLAEYHALGSARSDTSSVPVSLEAMTGHVIAHLAEPLTVARIAEAGRCSAATAERLFARHTGRSVLAWVRARRMEEAALLLRTTGLRVSEVARRTGFADPLYFSRVFRSTYSVPPSRYGTDQLRP